MRISNYIIIGAVTLVAVILVGCSKGSSKSPTYDTFISSTNLTDFGVVELSQVQPRHFSLGDGYDCAVTAKVLANDTIEVHMAVGLTNDDGTFRQIKTFTNTTFANIPVAFSLGKAGVKFLPKCSTP